MLRSLYQAESRRERAATLRAGLVAAAIYNVNRKKGTKALKPSDFIREPIKIVKPSQFARALGSFADEHNARLRKAQQVAGAEPRNLLGRGAAAEAPEKEAP